jgi:hypothetical protein
MAPHHKAMAWSLMDRALAVGSGMDFRPGARIGPGPTSPAADFAVWAHQIGYPDMEGAVDRVLACRPNGRERFPDDGREEMIDMAAKLALVDPETGREILRYIDQRLELTGTQLTPIHGGHLWLTAWALADLKHAEELFDRAVAEPKATRRKTAWKVPPQGLLGQGLGWSGLPKMAEVLALLPSLRLRAINRHFNFGPLSYDILGGLEDEDD